MTEARPDRRPANEPPRRLARELVLQALYSTEYGNATPETALGDLVSQEKLGESHILFARKLYASTLRRADWANERITRLAVNWEISRIAAVDRVILRMALVELDEYPGTPVKVILNEAIELAKRFSTAESARFVNGILDTAVKQSGRGNGATPK